MTIIKLNIPNKPKGLKIDVGLLGSFPNGYISIIDDGSDSVLEFGDVTNLEQFVEETTTEEPQPVIPENTGAIDSSNESEEE